MVFAGSGNLVSITTEGCGSTGESSVDDPAEGPEGATGVTGGTEAEGGTGGADILEIGGEVEAELAGGTTAELGVIIEGLVVRVEEETGEGICRGEDKETVGTRDGAHETGGGGGLESVVCVTT